MSENVTKNSSIHGIPLTQPVSWIPTPTYVSNISGHQQETQVTVLDNGLKVASETKFGQFCTVGGMAGHYSLSLIFPAVTVKK